jgi:hypothetical protein
MVLHIKYLKQKMGQDQLADLSHYIGWKDLLLSTDFMYDLTRLANMRGKMMEIDPQLPATTLAS